MAHKKEVLNGWFSGVNDAFFKANLDIRPNSGHPSRYENAGPFRGQNEVERAR